MKEQIEKTKEAIKEFEAIRWNRPLTIAVSEYREYLILQNQLAIMEHLSKEITVNIGDRWYVR